MGDDGDNFCPPAISSSFSSLTAPFHRRATLPWNLNLRRAWSLMPILADSGDSQIANAPVCFAAQLLDETRGFFLLYQAKIPPQLLAASG